MFEGIQPFGMALKTAEQSFKIPRTVHQEPINMSGREGLKPCFITLELMAWSWHEG